jgi:hypothetical protein
MASKNARATLDSRFECVDSGAARWTRLKLQQQQQQRGKLLWQKRLSFLRVAEAFKELENLKSASSFARGNSSSNQPLWQRRRRAFHGSRSFNYLWPFLSFRY